MPPDYGIVDGVAFYHADVVVGPKPARVGEVVQCDGIPNTDGGKYAWRLIRLRVDRPVAAAATAAAAAVRPSGSLRCSSFV
jgi:hypothetical protein